MLKYILIFGSIILFFGYCADESDKWTAVIFDNDTAIHVRKEMFHAKLIQKYELPFQTEGEIRTYSHVYVCIPEENVGADTIVLLHPNMEKMLGVNHCKECKDLEISPGSGSPITELYLPTEFVKSKYNNRFPIFAGKVDWSKK
ncbi:MAG: hypothetical protein KG003_13665 [Bacteroidetes bacterium]|nr:hypothetical protein [Bacteroidota bacterium]